MWSVINTISRDNLDAWSRWLTILAIGLPVLGALLGGLCGWGAFLVGERIGQLQEADLAQARNTISRQNADIDRLKPWRVSDNEAKKLQTALASIAPGKLAFAYRLMDGQGKDFADQLAGIFRAAGWLIGGIGGSSLNDFPGVTVATSLSLMQTADHLCDALTQAGIHCGGADLAPNSLGGPIEPGSILIIVGRKPTQP
jgi:hypothetical protein